MGLIGGLLGDRAARVQVVFKLLTEGTKELTPANILRQYVATAQHSIFSAEMRVLVEEALAQFQKKMGARGQNLSLVADTYQAKVGNPCLVEELLFKLVDIPQLAYEKDSGLFRLGFMDGVRRKLQGRDERSQSLASRHSQDLKSAYSPYGDKNVNLAFDSRSSEMEEQQAWHGHQSEYKGKQDPKYSYLHPDPQLMAIH